MVSDHDYSLESQDKFSVKEIDSYQYSDSSDTENTLKYQAPIHHSAQSIPQTTFHLSPSRTLIQPQPILTDPTTKYADDFRISAQNCRGIFHDENPIYEHYIQSIESYQSYQDESILLLAKNVDWKVNDNHHTASTHNKLIYQPFPRKITSSLCTCINRERSTFQVGGGPLYTRQWPSYTK